AGIGRLDQVVGQHLFLGRKLGPDLAAGCSALHADGFRQWQRLEIFSLTEDAGNTCENEREGQRHLDAHLGGPASNRRDSSRSCWQAVSSTKPAIVTIPLKCG